jgi:hypothetical protein
VSLNKTVTDGCCPQPHLNKSFEGIASIDFVPSTPALSAEPKNIQPGDVVITGMVSAEASNTVFQPAYAPQFQHC